MSTSSKINKHDVDETILTTSSEEFTELKSDFTEHESTKNPHGTTASDVGALPLTGGKMTGNYIDLFSGRGRLQTTYDATEIDSRSEVDDTGNRRLLSVYNPKSKASAYDSVKMHQYLGGKLTSYNIYGEHNKPSGSYTGNGSATTRTIDTGGIGSMCVVYGAYWNTIVMHYGAICFSNAGDGTFKTKPPEKMNFRQGVLTIADDSFEVNANAYIYSFEVK